MSKEDSHFQLSFTFTFGDASTQQHIEKVSQTFCLPPTGIDEYELC